MLISLRLILFDFIFIFVVVLGVVNGVGLHWWDSSSAPSKISRLESIFAEPTSSDELFTFGPVDCNFQTFGALVLVYYKGRHVCSGALITFNWVITSATCCYPDLNTKFLMVHVVGESVRGRTMVNGKFSHYSYRNNSPYHDLCLLRLDKPFFQFNQTFFAMRQNVGAKVCDTGLIVTYANKSLKCIASDTMECGDDLIFCADSDYEVVPGSPFACGRTIFGLSTIPVNNCTGFTKLSDYTNFLEWSIVRNTCAGREFKILLLIPILFLYS